MVSKWAPGTQHLRNDSMNSYHHTFLKISKNSFWTFTFLLDLIPTFYATVNLNLSYTVMNKDTYAPEWFPSKSFFRRLAEMGTWGVEGFSLVHWKPLTQAGASSGSDSAAWEGALASTHLSPNPSRTPLSRLPGGLFLSCWSAQNSYCPNLFT